MDKQELVKQAVMAYQEFPKASGRDCELVIVVSTTENTELGAGKLSYARLQSIGILGDLWEVACTHLEHITYRANLFEYGPKSANCCVMIGDEIVKWLKPSFMATHPANIWFLGDHEGEGARIPRPTPEEYAMLEASNQPRIIKGRSHGKSAFISGVDTSFIPEVGKECEYRYKHMAAMEFKVGTPDFIGEKLIILNSGYEQCYHIESLEFRPLKTEREKFVSKMVSVATGISEKELESVCTDEWDKIAEKLFDNDARFMESDNG